MQTPKRNWPATIAVSFALLGALSGLITTININENRISSLEAQGEKAEVVMFGLEKRLREVEGDSLVTNVVIGDLAQAVKEFSGTSKTLTEVVVRLDERVKSLEGQP